jgi:uncharacterized protein YbbC (DUF1343 family)
MKRVLLVTAITLITLTAICYGAEKDPIPGASRLELYRKIIKDKNIAVVANQTSMVGKTHLVDTLVSVGMKVRLILAPEHGFRNMADAGESIDDMEDPQTGIKVISLYGKHIKPTKADLKDIDIVVFDIQDVGVRYYTYTSTLSYVMEACSENNISCIVLDRPDPNGFYVDGNILDTAYSSMVGMHPVPIVHGMTIGEYAGMLNGEKWLHGKVICDLTVIKCKYYTHKTYYNLPVRPSPNLPNQNSIYLYPSICLFEGTCLSLGRGTSFPFQVFGSPEFPDTGFSFIPESLPGAKNPPLLGYRCFGTDLRDAIEKKIVPSPFVNLYWIIKAYNDFPEKGKFFNSSFDRLAGGPVLREQITKGMSAEEIRATWKEGLEKFRKTRSKYLLYK